MTQQLGMVRGGLNIVFVTLLLACGLILGANPETDAALTPAATWSSVGANDGDKVGAALSAWGDVNGDGYMDLIVGTPWMNSRRGKALVMYGSANGLTGSVLSPAWSYQGENENDDFGRSVAHIGDVNGDGYGDVAVGASLYPNSTAVGRVYIFHGSASGLPSSPNRTITAVYGGDYFGWDVAGAGDVNGDGYADLLVGSPSAAGAAYVFHGSASGITGTQPSEAAWAGPGGYAVAGLGDVNGDGYSDVASGAPYNAFDSGMVYVYLGSAAGLGGSASWIGTGEFNQNRFGWDVAGAGDVNADGYCDLLVGAAAYDGEGGSRAYGKAYLFLGNASGIQGSPAAPAWSVAGAMQQERVGQVVAGAGDVSGDGFADILVGSDNTNSRGQALLFLGRTNGITGTRATAAWMYTGADYEQAAAALGGAGDFNGDGYADAAVGATGVQNSRGAVYAFHGQADPPTNTRVAVGEADFGYLGSGLAGRGDYNGDGFDDVALAAEGYDRMTGKIYVFHGTAHGVDFNLSVPAWSLTGTSSYDVLGGVDNAGDVNGDGFDDLVVSAPGFGTGRGRVMVFHGSAAGIQGTWATPAWYAHGEADYDNLGRKVCGAHDINGDGFADILVSAPNNSDTRGKVYAFFGSTNGIQGVPATARWSLNGLAVGDYLGDTLAGAGDVNGDGFADIIIGADNYNGNQGVVYAFHGGINGVSGNLANPAWVGSGEHAGSLFGAALAGAGDVNGDGFSDIIVGAREYSSGWVSQGKAYIFAGSSGGLQGNTGSQFWNVAGTGPSNYLGWAVAGAGDVNGDGVADVLVSDVLNAGTVYLFHGSVDPAGMPTVPARQFVNPYDGDFGLRLAGAGDVNADGYADFLAAAPNGAGDRGRVFLFQGNGGAGCLKFTSQWQVLPQMIAWNGFSRSADRFAALQFVAAPMGKGQLKLQVQAVQAGQSFASPQVVNGAKTNWQASSAGGMSVLSHIQTGMTQGRAYQWRARALYAPFSVTNAVITPPPNPAHSPWYTCRAQADNLAIRIGQVPPSVALPWLMLLLQ